MIKIRIENLKAGLMAIEKAKSEQIKDKQVFGGVWWVYPKDGWYLLTSHVFSLTFLFFTRDIIEVMHPSIIELGDQNKLCNLGSPENWDSTRKGEWNLWLACFIESLRINNYKEDEVFAFFKIVSTEPIDEWSEEVTDLIKKIPLKKKEQYDFLVKNIGEKNWVKKLLKDSQYNISDIKNMFQKSELPIIHLPPKAKNEVLAQMCLWAYRKRGRLDEDNHLFEYFKEHIKNVIKKFFIGNKIDDMIIDSVVAKVSDHIINNYHASFSCGSFTSYIQRCAQGFIKQEIELAVPTENINQQMDKVEFKKCQNEDDSYSDDSYNDSSIYLNRDDKDDYTVTEAALIIDSEIGSEDKTNTENWLYDQLKKGKIPGHKPEKIITEQRTLFRRPSGDSIKLNEEELKQAKDLFVIKKLRRMELTKLIADKRNTSPQAARGWLNRRLKKGTKITVICEEAGITSNDFMKK